MFLVELPLAEINRTIWFDKELSIFTFYGFLGIGEGAMLSDGMKVLGCRLDERKRDEVAFFIQSELLSLAYLTL